MEEFDFDYHACTAQYPESGDRVQLGGSYSFSSAPTAPDQRILTLHFDGMVNYWDAVGGVPDTATNPKRNFYRLELFYKRHRLWKSFNYRHAQYGILVVKFNKPLSTPKPSGDRQSTTDGFTLELLEIP